MRSFARLFRFLVFLGVLPLTAQSYQTSFSEVKYDRGKSPVTLHGNAEVEGASGALSVRIPLGPGIGIRNLHYAPALVGRWHPQAWVSSKAFVDSDGYVYAYQSYLHYGNRSGFALDPGHLMLSLGDPNEEQQYVAVTNPGSARENMQRTPATTMSNFQLPSGESGSVIGSEGGLGSPPYSGSGSVSQLIPGARVPSVSEAGALLTAYGFGPEWTIGATPYDVMQQDLSTYASQLPFISLGSNGELILGVIRVADVPGSVNIVPIARIEKMGVSDSRVCVPRKILVLKGDALYEFDWVLNDFGPYVGGYRSNPTNIDYLNPPMSFLHGALFTCVSQRNRFGDRLRFEPNATATGGFRAWIESNGAPIGPEICFEETTRALTYRMGGRDIPMFLFEGLARAPYVDNDLPCGSGGLAAHKLTTLRNLATNETMQFEYGPITFPPGSYYCTEFPFEVLTSFQEAGETTTFTWKSYDHLRTGNTLDGGGYTGLYIQNNLIPGGNGFHPSFAIGVTEVKETVGPVVRSTLHERVLPKPNLTLNWTQWTSTAFTNTITLPDARKVKHLYVEPLYGKNKGATLLEDLQLLAYSKHLERRREEYDAAGKLVRVVDHPMDSLALRHFTNPTGVMAGNSMPYFTRTTTTTYEAATGAEVSRVEQEQKDYDALNPGWRTETLKASSGGAVQADRTTSRAFQWRSDLGTAVLTTLEAVPGKPTARSTYDSHGRLSLQTFNEGGAGSSLTLRYSYQPTGVAGFNYVPSPAPSTITAEGSADLNLSGQVGARYGYDALGRLERIGRLGVGWTAAQTTDDLGRVVSQTDPNGLARTFEWDDGGRLKAIRLQGEEPTLYSYDTDFLGVIIQRGAQYSRLRFNGFGEPIREIRKNGAGTFSHRRYGYDFAGRKAWESVWLPLEGDDAAWTSALAPGESMTGGTPGGWAQECTRWLFDRFTGEERCVEYQNVYVPPQDPTYSNLKSTHYAYDPQGRVVKVTDPNGVVRATVFSKGSSGERRAITVGSGTDASTTTFDHDALGRLAGVTDALSQPTTYAYDDADRITRVIQTDPAYPTRTQTRTWAYNTLGWLLNLTQPESSTTSYSAFDVNGKPWTTSYNGRVVNATFDALGRMLSATAPDGSVNQAFTWDTAPSNGKGKLRTATANGVAREMDYGGVGGRLSTLTRTVDGIPFVQRFTYDTYGNLSSRTYPDNKVQTLTPDLATGLPVTSVFNGVSVMPVATYDATHWGLTTLTLANGATSFFTYGPDQTRLGSLRHQVPGRLDRTWTYGYDDQSRLLSAVGTDVQNTVGFRQDEERYTYDALGRLKTAMARDPWDTTTGYASRGLFQSFDYDPFGNRFTGNTSTITNWPANQPPATATLSASLRAGLDKVVANVAFSRTDAAFLQNRLPSSAGSVYDLQGNLTQVFPRVGASGESVNLAYDALGRVSSLSYGPTATRKSESYLHDDEGLRIRVWDGTKYRYNVYNEGRQLIAQYEKIGTGSLTWKKNIVYVGTKELAEVSSDGKTYVTLNDHLSSPRFLYDGTTLSQQKFLPFGEGLADALSAAKFAKGFTNHEQTDASGLIYMQARFYVPWYGRFLSPDPARDQHFEETQSWNIYSYVQNNPTMSIDPDGMREWNLKNRALGALRMAQGAAQVGLAYTAGMVSAMSGKGAPVVPILAAGVAAKGGDNFQAGAQQLLSGNHVDNASTQGIAGTTGMSVEKARMVDGVVDFAATVSLGMAQFKINANLDVITGNGGASLTTQGGGNSPDFFAGTKYSDKVQAQMQTGDLHGFPEAVKNFQSSGTVSEITGGDGLVRQMLKIPGEYRGRGGNFEFIKEADGTINHRLFKPE